MCEKKTLDYILEHKVGGGGWWQWKTLLFSCPLYLASTLTLLIHLFTVFEPQHRCKIDQCEAFGSAVDANWTKFALPLQIEANEFLSKAAEIDSCHRFEFFSPDGECKVENFNKDNILPCDSWVYDESEFPETLSTKINLVCGDEPKKKFLSTIVMSGLLIGSIVGGRLSDIIGRKKTLFMAVIAMAISTGAAGAIPNYYLFAVLRLIACSCAAVIWVSYYSCMLEFFSARNSELLLSVLDAQGPTGILIQILLSYFFRDWRQAHLAAGIVCAFPLLFWSLTPESIRWQVQNGRKSKAVEQLKKIAEGNGKSLDKDDINEINEIMDRIEKTANEKTEQKLSPLVMVKKGYRLTTFTLILSWVSICVGSYTLSFSATELSGDLFLNMALLNLVDIPAAVVMYIGLKMFKRKNMTAVVMLLSGICCLVLAFMPLNLSNLILFFYLAGKLFVGIGFSMVWFVTMELYPTNMRSQALGTCSMMARVFGLISPFVGSLSVYWRPLPMLLLGCPQLIASFMTYFHLPETSKADIPQDMKEALKLNKSREKNIN